MLVDSSSRAVEPLAPSSKATKIPALSVPPGTGSWALPPLLLCERGLEMGITGV